VFTVPGSHDVTKATSHVTLNANSWLNADIYEKKNQFNIPSRSIFVLTVPGSQEVTRESLGDMRDANS
jgi:hypothetical protein